jgi:Protein of unknown function (DUF2867)
MRNSTAGPLRVDEQVRLVDATPGDLWHVIVRFGAANRWYSPPLVWSARGLLDRLAGGIGVRPGRPGPDELAVGDALDFWRVEDLRPGELLRLRAEMRTPGTVWLELGAGTDSAGRTVYRQRTLFRPRGRLGALYWWSLRPFDTALFAVMARTVTAAAERRRGATDQGAQEPGPTA